MVAAAPAEGRGRIPELDGIRGVAILLVLAWHYLANQWHFLANDRRFEIFAHGGNGALALTWSGVDLFFVLSGFLIGGILIDHRSVPNYFRAFYARRAFRILPLYVVWVMLFGAARWLHGGGNAAFGWLFAHPMPAWSYLTFTQNFAMARAGTFGANWIAMTWSLAIEEQFYLVLPLLVFLTPPRRLPHLLVALIVLAPVSRFALLSAEPANTLGPFLIPFCRADSLLLGVLGAWAMRADRERLTRARPLLMLALGACAIMLLLMIAAHQIFGTSGMNSYGLTFLAIFYTSLLLLIVTARNGVLAHAARWMPLRAMGIIAYAAYIFHQGVSGLLYAALRGHAPAIARGADGAVTALALAVTIGAATLSWFALERPLLAIGHRFRYD